MRSTPSVFVNCDVCNTEIEILLLSTGDQDYFVDEELRDKGWFVDSEDYCPKCRKEFEDQKEDQE